MAIRWGRVLLLAWLGASGAALGQEGSFGPRPIYLRGSALAWQVTFDASRDEVFDAVKKTGKALGFKVVARDGEAGVLRLAKSNQKGAVLDGLCRYPIVNYYSWRPIQNFASAQNAALGQRVRGESLARAGRLNGTIHVSIRDVGGGAFAVQSICSAYLRQWGIVEASSLGVLEKSFLEDLLERMGTPMDVSLPETVVVEPSRANPTRDLHRADICQKRCVAGYQCAGMYVDLETLELMCVGGVPEEGKP